MYYTFPEFLPTAAYIKIALLDLQMAALPYL